MSYTIVANYALLLESAISAMHKLLQTLKVIEYSGPLTPGPQCRVFVCFLQKIERKMAELHYKNALALQFLDEPEKALQHTNVSQLEDT